MNCRGSAVRRNGKIWVCSARLDEENYLKLANKWYFLMQPPPVKFSAFAFDNLNVL